MATVIIPLVAKSHDPSSKDRVIAQSVGKFGIRGLPAGVAGLAVQLKYCRGPFMIRIWFWAPLAIV